MSDVAKLSVGEHELELPVIVGTEDEQGLDISKLRGLTGYITLDEGFVNTGSTQSAITLLDGEKGILRYRGYAIEEICKKCDFVDSTLLLLNGELPSEEQRESFRQAVIADMQLPAGMEQLIEAFPRDAHPMAMLASCINALSTHHQDQVDPLDSEQVQNSTQRLIATLPTIAAAIHRHRSGKPFVAPNPELGYVENFLTMMFADDEGQYEVDSDFVDAINLLLIVHLDQEQN